MHASRSLYNVIDYKLVTATIMLSDGLRSQHTSCKNNFTEKGYFTILLKIISGDHIFKNNNNNNNNNKKKKKKKKKKNFKFFNLKSTNNRQIQENNN